MSRLPLLATAGLLALAAACGSGGGEAGPTGTGASTSGEVSTVTIEFSVEGGFANLARSITIRGDRSATWVRSGRELQGSVGADQVAAIERELDGSGLFDRDRDYPAPSGGADLQRYVIRYRGATVVAFDTTVPAELADAVRLLEEAIAGG